MRHFAAHWQCDERDEDGHGLACSEKCDLGCVRRADAFLPPALNGLYGFPGNRPVVDIDSSLYTYSRWIVGYRCWSSCTFFLSLTVTPWLCIASIARLRQTQRSPHVAYIRPEASFEKWAGYESLERYEPRKNSSTTKITYSQNGLVNHFERPTSP